MKYDVISFGSAVLDVFLKAPDLRIIESKEVFTDRALILPYGIKSEVDELHICSGGGGTNTAVGFARLGLKTAIVARCGWDFAGKLIRQEIKKEKVFDELLVQLEGERTDYSTILIGPDGNRTILVYRGGTGLEKSVVDFQKLNSFWFYITSLEGNLDLLKTLVGLAKKNHIKVALNPGRREIKQKKELLEIVKEIEFFIVNEKEAALLTDLSSRMEVLKNLIAHLPRTNLVVTRGTNGVYLHQSGGKKIEKPALKVKMVDQTGAGDAFGSGFIGGLASGFSIERALDLGIANGASVVGEIGAKEGLIKKSEIDFYLDKGGK